MGSLRTDFCLRGIYRNVFKSGADRRGLYTVRVAVGEMCPPVNTWKKCVTKYQLFMYDRVPLPLNA